MGAYRQSEGNSGSVRLAMMGPRKPMEKAAFRNEGYLKLSQCLTYCVKGFSKGQLSHDMLGMKVVKKLAAERQGCHSNMGKC